MATAYDASLIERIMPRIKQYESTTGRRVSPAMLDALIKGQLSTESERATRERALDIQEQGLADAKEAQKKADKAAGIKGYVDTASTAGMGYLTYKALTKPSPMSELIAYQKSLGTKPLATDALPSVAAPAYAGGVPAVATPGAAPSLTAGASGVEWGTGIGAQTSLAGGAPAVGAQVVPQAAYASAPEAAAITGQGAWAEPAVATSSGVGSMVLPAAAVVAGTKYFGPTVGKALGWSETSGKRTVSGGLLAGGINEAVERNFSDSTANVINTIINPVGKLIDVVGDASVICSELLRQGRITKCERSAAIVFRYRHIDDTMFYAYLHWATPIVANMRRHKWFNLLTLPFTMRFVRYMSKIGSGNEQNVTMLERLAFQYAWWRCKKIAESHAGDALLAGVA